jgi:hypothetical protein
LSGQSEGSSRANEWYALKHGPMKLRSIVNMTFLPYTLMNASYTVIGSLLGPGPVHWDRVAAIAFVYVLAVGVSSHALDARAPNKPWGRFMTDRQLLVLALCALVPALAVGIYYAALAAPLLWVLGIPELFFLFAYNMELFGSRFHTDFWFAVSWGFLPVLSGFVMQTNGLNLTALAAGAFGFVSAHVEISASRPYKRLMRSGSPTEEAARYEGILKGVVTCVAALALLLVIVRWAVPLG